MRKLLRTVRVALVVAQWTIVAVSLYQSAVTLAGRRRGRPPLPPATGSPPRFVLLVCARNEASIVGGILQDLSAQEYEGECEVLLVAHNSDDGTAEVGRRAGARVVEANTVAEGKVVAMQAGMALAPECDYVGVFDADSRAHATLLTEVARAIPGEDCLQVETVPHPTHDWLATGYGLGRRARNLFWWRPREALGLGTTLSGSGYFIRPALLRDLLDNVHTMTEDLELTAQVYARGSRVAYTSSTRVQVEEAHGFSSSIRQRLRWVRGHLAVVRHYSGPLWRESLRGDVRAFDISVYLLCPSRVVTRTGVTLAFLLAWVNAPVAIPMRVVALALSGEWGLPAAIAVRERLVPLSLGGMSAALRHGILSLLWFPIGLWAIITPRDRTWAPVPRVGASAVEDRDAAPAA